MKINGWLFVDKPEGVSSRKVVDLISNSLSIKKVSTGISKNSSLNNGCIK